MGMNYSSNSRQHDFVRDASFEVALTASPCLPFSFIATVKGIEFRKNFSLISAIIIGLLFTKTISAQQVIPIYSDSIPNSTGYKMLEIPVRFNGGPVTGLRNISEPSLTIYLPSGEEATASDD